MIKMASLPTAGLLLLSIFQLLSCSFTMATPTTKPVDAQSQNLFASNLFPLILETKSSENVIYSPASIHSSLALTYLGANGQTANELRQVLHLPDEEKSTFAAKYGNFLVNAFNGDAKTDDNKPQLKMNTRLYVNNNVRILPEFNTLAKKTFGCEAENVDFGKSATAVAKINKWVEDQTANKIKNLLQKDAVDGETTGVLINTIYFKAKWLHPFSADATTRRPFHVSPTKQVDVDLMFTEEQFAYAELDDMDAKVLEMPYANSDISMLVILPNKLDGLSQLEKNLKGKDLNDIAKKLVRQSVEVSLPKFRIEFDIDLKKTLQKMGLPSMFNANANLSGIFATPQKISDVKHKAYLECNEAGSEAAAATFMQISLMSINMNQKVFRADHPFVFMIRSKSVVYFAGHVAKF